MNAKERYHQIRRRRFLTFVIACVILSYPCMMLFGAPSQFFSLDAPLKLAKVYASAWFATPTTVLVWLVFHALFIRVCRQWLQRGDLPSWFLTLLFGCAISALGTMYAYLLVHPFHMPGDGIRP